MSNDFLFTSESVSEGHPDKVADQISDAILDAILAQDPKFARRRRDACHHRPGGARRRDHHQRHVDYIQVARNTIKRIGYDNTEYGIDYKGCAVMVCYDKQSAGHRPGRRRRRGLRPRTGRRRPGPDVRLRLRRDARADAGADLLRAPSGRAPGRHCAATAACPGCAPTPRPRSRCATWTASRTRIDTVVLSTQHRPDSRAPRRPARSRDRGDHQAGAAEGPAQGHTKYLVNPTGRFVVGGPQGDCGLTGRKIIVDTYGGAAPHGGGAFSGKDPSKVDRSAAYAAALRGQEHRGRRPCHASARCRCATRSAWPSR